MGLANWCINILAMTCRGIKVEKGRKDWTRREQAQMGMRQRDVSYRCGAWAAGRRTCLVV